MIKKFGKLSGFITKGIFNKMEQILEALKNDRDKLERLTQKERLGELLLRQRLLKLQNLVELMQEYQADRNCPLGEFLIRKKLLTNQKLLDRKSTRLNSSHV